MAEEQRLKFEGLRQLRGESVYMWNDRFNYERELLHELKMASYLTSGTQDFMWDRSMNSEHPCMVVEEARDTLRYISAMTDALRASVSSWHTLEFVQRRIATAGDQRVPISLKQVQSAALNFEKVARLKAGFPQGSQVDVVAHSARGPLAITNGPHGWPATSFRRRARDPSLPARLRINNIESEHDEVEDIDTGSTDLERLYATMTPEGKVSWTRAQLKLLMDKNLCFKCAKAGHRAPECRNADVDPKTFRFTHLTELTSFDEEDVDLFHDLHELGDLETRGGAENGSASR